jgi:hypothetical protein
MAKGAAPRSGPASFATRREAQGRGATLTVTPGYATLLAWHLLCSYSKSLMSCEWPARAGKPEPAPAPS